MSWKKIFKIYKLNWLLKDIWYRLDWRKPNSSSIKSFLQENIAMAQQLAYEKKLPLFSGTRDVVILKILKWVIANIVYEVDSKRFKVAEKWQNVNETQIFKRGDCEDGAILIFALARVHNINPMQIKLVAGDVKFNGKKVGHCWVEYMSDECFGEWHTIDWCYWPTTQPFSERIPKSVNYQKDWFAITDLEVD